MKDLVAKIQKPVPIKQYWIISRQRKLTDDQVRIARYEFKHRASLANKVSSKILAKRYGVSTTTMNAIVNYHYYREVPDMTSIEYRESKRNKKAKELTVGEQVKRDKKKKGSAALDALRASIDL